MSEPVEIKPGDPVCLKGHLTELMVGRVATSTGTTEDTTPVAQCFWHTDDGDIKSMWIPLVCLELADLEESAEESLNEDESEYGKHLLLCEAKLNALTAYGVCNWENYDAAMATVAKYSGYSEG